MSDFMVLDCSAAMDSDARKCLDELEKYCFSKCEARKFTKPSRPNSLNSPKPAVCVIICFLPDSIAHALLRCDIAVSNI